MAPPIAGELRAANPSLPLASSPRRWQPPRSASLLPLMTHVWKFQAQVGVGTLAREGLKAESLKEGLPQGS